MDVNNLTSVYNQNPTLQSQYTLQQYLDMFGGSSTGNTGTTAQTQTTTPTSNASQGIIGSNINQYQTGGGDGYNPYQPNANVNTSYQPNYDYRQHIDYDPNLTATANQKQFDMNQNYYNKPAPSGIAKAINTGINMIPGIGTVKKGMEFVGNTLGKYMPVNQRGIFENELRGSGVFTDAIGRIAIGPDGKYNTPEGIMAGYNASQMDPTKENNAWDRRTDNLTDTLADKAKGLGLDITKADLEAIAKEIEETGKYTGEYTDDTFGVKNLFSNLTNVNLNKFMVTKTRKKSQDIFDFEVAKKEKEKQRKAQEKIQATIQKGLDQGKSLNQIGKENFTGKGMAFEQKTPTNKTGYNPPRRDGGLMGKGGSRFKSYFDGGLVTLRRR